MKYTTNYSLKKPDLTDVVNIDDLNDNADIIDAQLAEKVNKVISLEYSAEWKSNDANLAIENGTYYIPIGGSNVPETSASTIVTNKITVNYLQQILTNALGHMFVRSYSDGSWGIWKRIIDETMDTFTPGSNGHMKFANGFIIQWASVSSAAHGQEFNFPIAFPNACLKAVGQHNTSGVPCAVTINVTDRAKYKIYNSNSGVIYAHVIAIGY